MARPAINTFKISEIINNHKLWLDDNETGEQANLQEANLQEANLQGANLQGADLQEANLQEADLQGADLQGADLRRANLQGADLQVANLQGADLQGANLRGANLRGADLQGANFDYSCFPLWCGGTRFKADDKLIKQVLAHLCSLIVSPEAAEIIDKIRDYAKTSHRAAACGLLDKEGE